MTALACCKLKNHNVNVHVVVSGGGGYGEESFGARSGFEGIDKFAVIFSLGA